MTFMKPYKPIFKEETPKEGTQEWAQNLYVKNELIPGNWYVHGRANSQQLSNYIAMSTKQWHVADQYAGHNGSIWLLCPNSSSKVLDIGTNSGTQKVINKFIKDKNKLPEEYQSINEEEIEKIFDPKNIVDSAEAYDDPVLVEWIISSFHPDVILLTNNAAIFMGSNAKFDRIKIQG